MNNFKSNEVYDAKQITVLDGLEAVRKHPSMYIGDISQRGLHHLVYEVVDNSIDEALAGYANKIEVFIHKDNSITVIDNGRGIPVDIHSGEGKSALEVVLTTLHAGGKFDHSIYKISGGLHGVGVSCVNALSEWLEVRIYKDNFIYYMKFKEGEVVTNLCKLGNTDKIGTTITFKPDNKIFVVTDYKWSILSSRLRELGYLNDGISISLIDEREDIIKKESFYYKDGIKEFVSYINSNKTVLHDDIIYSHKNIDNVDVEIALQYHNGFSETILCYANNIHTVEGGTHLIGFQLAITRAMNHYLKKSISIKEQKNMLGTDVREGLTAVINIKVISPQFEGQTKTKLGNIKVKSIVEEVVYKMLDYFLEENPNIAKIILTKILVASKAREAAKKARELVQYKSVFESFSLPGKLSDCSIKDPKLCELYIVEGDSAGGSAKQGRDSSFQAILPIRGKLINVEKARVDKVLENKEIQSIISVIGCGSGYTEFDVTKVRYHKIIIMTDADIDGSHIKTLILTFIYRQMKQLIENGYIYIAKPPLFRIKPKNIKEKYIVDEDELDKYLINFGCKNITIYDFFKKVQLNSEFIDKLLKILYMISDINTAFKKYDISPFVYFSKINERNKYPIAKISYRTNDGMLFEKFVYSSQEKITFISEITNNSIDEIKSNSDAKNCKIFPIASITNIYETKRVKNFIDVMYKYNFNDSLLSCSNKVFKIVNMKNNESISVNSIFKLFDIIKNIGSVGVDVQRYKGLGEMNAEQLWETTMCPDNRSMIKVTMEDAIEAEKIFSLLMGEDVAPRREYIEKYATGAINLDI